MEGNDIPKNSDEPTKHATITIDMSKFDSNTKAYIDTACQNTANMIIASIKAYIDQNGATQSATISKLNKHIDTTSPQQQLSSQQQEATHNHTQLHTNNAFTPALKQSISEKSHCLKIKKNCEDTVESQQFAIANPFVTKHYGWTPKCLKDALENVTNTY
ncbi:30892_t:CDS:2 [Gigaspora margarita]|uniref:30892_t:CDS:1 n=1 Tax=Gigaspora margarita TaxID=4874 RepID=A0ABN7WKE1_GIGMA|nr:30892_t:CDS:2 [Gigaspora margarita]